MKHNLRTILILGLAVALTACSTPVAPTQAPTVNVEPTLNAARTEAAATVAAEIGQKATEAQPAATATTEAPLVATATAEPTATPLPPANTPTTAPAPATATSAPTTKPTSAVVVTLAPVEFGCKITASSTTGDSSKAPDSDFDAKWTIKNTGTSKWESGTIDYKYSSGTKMQQSGDIFDINTAIAVGDTLDIVVDMKAPSTPGNYQSNWAVVRGSTVLCTLPVLITVK